VSEAMNEPASATTTTTTTTTENGHTPSQQQGGLDCILTQQRCNVHTNDAIPFPLFYFTFFFVAFCG
jgi:hypothetical protein